MWREIGGEPVSVPYSWLQGEFDSFSSVTLKVSFSTPGCYRHAGPDSFKPLPRGIKKREKKKKIAKLDNECIWKETKMTYRLCADMDWCCITHHSNKQREPKHNVHFVLFKGNSWITLKGFVNIHCNTMALEGQCKQSHAYSHYSIGKRSYCSVAAKNFSSHN